MKKTTLLLLLLSLVTVCEAQSRYCMTYEDFVNNHWVTADTLFVVKRSTLGRMWTGSDYKIKSDDKSLNSIIKKNAFVVMQGDSMYVNNRNLRFQETGFGGGYSKARKIGTRSIFFVNRMIGKEVENERTSIGVSFGLAGALIAVSQSVKFQVCYVISSGADEKGRIDIRLIDDDLIKQMLLEQAPSLLKEYFAESDWKKRIGASRVLPILEKSGLIRMN